MRLFEIASAYATLPLRMPEALEGEGEGARERVRERERDGERGREGNKSQ